MSNTVRIEESKKHGFRDRESYIVTRGKTSYLRIIGNAPVYALMTATASEDDRSYGVCKNRIRLVSSALQLCARLGILPSRATDSSGRVFINICEIGFSPGNEQEDLAEFNAVIEVFFQIFDRCDPGSSEVVSDMRDIYAGLSDNSSNEDVYLSDGVWLGVDGRLHT
jgi:hypothetical protein